MQFSAAQISQLINGTVEGNENEIVNSFGKIEEAKESQITFLSNPKYEEYLYTSSASVVILNKNYTLKQPIKATIIRVADSYTAFVTLLTKYKELASQQMKGIQQPVYIAPSATIGEDVFIGAFTYIGENVTIGNNTKILPNTYIGNYVQVGENCLFYSGVKIYDDCVVKNNVILHSGVVIGSDGFGFLPQKDGTFQKIPQMGNVVLEDHVEVGSNTAIDRATMGSTIIHAGVKLDNLIQVGHNVEIGNNTVIAALTGIAGSTKLGKNIMVGGQAAFVEHIQIADGSKIGAQAKVTKSLTKPNSNVNDTPAFEYSKSLRSQALYRNLPELEKRIAALEKNSGDNSITEK